MARTVGAKNKPKEYTPPKIKKPTKTRKTKTASNENNNENVEQKK